MQKKETTGIIRRPRGRPKKTSTITTAPTDGNGNTGTLVTSSDTRQAIQFCLSGSPSIQTLTRSSASAVNVTPDINDTNSIVSKLVETLSSIILHRLSYGDPSSDLLVHVTTLNSLRAIVYIMDMLDIGVNEMDDENSISAFNSQNPTVVARRRLLPESLQPTALQLAVLHHPWIDAFPFPTFRDKLMIHADALAANDGELSDATLCSDMLGLEAHASAGFLVWGNPWDASAWEMSEKFFRKWHWILGGCDELVKWTNYWRARRGEPGLVV